VLSKKKNLPSITLAIFAREYKNSQSSKLDNVMQIAENNFINCNFSKSFIYLKYYEFKLNVKIESVAG